MPLFSFSPLMLRHYFDACAPPLSFITRRFRHAGFRRHYAISLPLLIILPFDFRHIFFACRFRRCRYAIITLMVAAAMPLRRRASFSRYCCHFRCHYCLSLTPLADIILLRRIIAFEFRRYRFVSPIFSPFRQLCRFRFRFDAAAA